MIELPDYIDFVRAENAAAGMVRGLTERTEAWGRLIAQAQRILASVQNTFARGSDEFNAEELYLPEESAPIVAAARILDCASQTQGVDEKHRMGLALCAAAAFAMYGNFPGAHAVISRLEKLTKLASPRLWLAAGCFSPRDAAKARIQAIEQNDGLSSAAIECLQAFLLTGDVRQIKQADQYILASFPNCIDNLENLLLGYARVALKHIQVLSTKGALSQASSLPASVVEQLLHQDLPTLLPSQFAVLCRSKLLESQGNSLISLPTSTGKTLVGELAIAVALGAKPGLAVYVAPYVAIGMQAARALKQHLPNRFECTR